MQSNKVGYKGLWGQRSLALVTREICTPICYFCSPIQKWKGIIRIPTFVSKQTCSQNENDKIGETDYSKDKVDQNAEPNWNSAVSKFMLKIIAGDKILESINSQNSK